MWFFEREIPDLIAEKVDPRAQQHWFWRDFQIKAGTRLKFRLTRGQMDIVLANRNRVRVRINGGVSNLVLHGRVFSLFEGKCGPPKVQSGASRDLQLGIQLSRIDCVREIRMSNTIREGAKIGGQAGQKLVQVSPIPDSIHGTK